MLIGLAGLLAASCSGAAHSAAGISVARTRSAAPAPSAPRSPSPSAAGQADSSVRYREYGNARYGFTTLWPSSLRAQPPPEDGDGQAWALASPKGQILLAAYGANNVLNYSPRRDEAADSRGLAVVYRNISGNIVTVSGYKHGGRVIVYQRDVVGHGAIDTLYWRYPASERAEWDAAVTVTAGAFKPGDLTNAH